MLFEFRSRFRLSFWVEAVTLIICPIPFFDFIIEMGAPSEDRMSRIQIYYLLSDFILAFMFTRSFFLMRAFFNYTMFMDAYSKKLCKSFGFTANVRYAYKCYLKKSPGKTIFLTIFASIMIAGYVLKIFELPYAFATGYLPLSGYYTKIWCIVITVTSVGFGDTYPSTVFGRCLIIIVAFWGAFCTSLMVLSTKIAFDLKEREREALHHLLQTRRAACSITAAIRYYMAKQKYLKSGQSEFFGMEDVMISD